MYGSIYIMNSVLVWSLKESLYIKSIYDTLYIMNNVFIFD